MSEPLTHKIAATYRELGRRGFVPGSAGNVSVRSTKGMLITPSGCSADAVTGADIVAVTFDGRTRNGTPSSEWPMHAAIYRAFADAQAIVHTHSDACTALACLNDPLPAFHYMITAFGGNDVRCAPYVTFGTPELAQRAVAALQDRSACLLANHGMIVHAASLDRALTNAIILESLCRQYLLARAAGTPRLLSTDEIAAARERFRTYGPLSVPGRKS
ncbi:MAG TPA: class II aldolase/adducin family protein [Acetobacteraceae bacterium]|nr:class II aldolase/adducin family protein [Acetobacteraceae bacterium]